MSEEVYQEGYEKGYDDALSEAEDFILKFQASNNSLEAALRQLLRTIADIPALAVTPRTHAPYRRPLMDAITQAESLLAK